MRWHLVTAAALSVSHRILSSTRLFACRFTVIVIARDTVQQAVVQNEHVASKDMMNTYESDDQHNSFVAVAQAHTSARSKRSPAKRNEGIASVLHLDLDVHRLRVFEKGVSQCP